MRISTKGILVILFLSLFMIVLYALKAQPEVSWTNEDGTAIVCRSPGCSSTPAYPDWNRRFCSEHLNDTHYCRHPHCMNPVPNSSKEEYCSQHD